MKTTLLLSMFASLAFAQVGVCKTGSKCSSRDFTSTLKGGPGVCNQGPNASWAWDTGSSVSTFGWYAAGTRCTGGATTLISMSINENVVSANAAGGWRSGTAGFQAADGSLTQTSFSWSSDANSGFYHTASDTFAAVTGGARSFSFMPTSGVLEGTTSTPSLALNASGSTLTYGSTIMSAQNLLEVHSGATEGIRITTDNVTAWGTANAQVFQVDTQSGRMYWTRTTTRGDTPPVDLGGKAHPVLQQRTYVVDVGTESAATPTWNFAPRVGGTTATVTVADGAAASSATLGAAPYVFDFRVMNTTATAAPGAGSTSSLITTAFVKRGRGSRWAQRVSTTNKTSVRLAVGLTSALAVNTDANWNVTHSVFFRSSSAVPDANWTACSADGATLSCTDTTISVDTSAAQILTIDCREAAACTFWINGVARVRKTTNLPSAGTNTFPFQLVESLSAAVRTFYGSSISVEHN